MKPPYNPAHVENVSTVAGTGNSVVVATCSCTTHRLGPHRLLGRPGVARDLAADFNAHRATYVPQETTA